MFFFSFLLFSFLDDCHDKIELGLLIDTSSSYGEGEEWRKVKLFVTLFLNYYEIDANKTRLGVITYRRNAKILFELHDQEYQTSEAAAKAIETALEGVEPGGNPLTEKALTKAHDVLFEKPPQSNKQRVLFVFTGGKTPNPQLYDDIVRSIEVRRMYSLFLLLLLLFFSGIRGFFFGRFFLLLLLSVLCFRDSDWDSNIKCQRTGKICSL